MLKEIVLPPIDMKKFSDQPIDSNLIIMSHDFNVNELVIPFYETTVFDTYEAFYSFQGNTSIIIQEVYKQNNEIRIPIVNDVRRHKGIFTIELNASSNSTQATLLKLNVMVKRSNIDSNSEFLFNHYYKLFEDYEKEIAELSNVTQSTIKTQLKQSQDNLQKVTKTLVAVNDKVMVVNDTADGFMADVATKQADVTSKYNAFDTSVTTAGQTIDDILALQPQFQSVLDETTGKDVISAPEIILARNGEADLKARLDKDQQQVTAQLAQTVKSINTLTPIGHTQTLAHRGFSRLAPEGSMPAFLQAYDSGFWGWEADAQRSTDGVWYIFHDTTLDRMTDGTGRLRDKTSTYLDSLTINFGNNIAHHPNLKIPKLRDFLLLSKRFKVPVCVEIKTDNVEGDFTGEDYASFVELIKECGVSDSIIVAGYKNVTQSILERLSSAITMTFDVVETLQTPNGDYLKNNNSIIATNEVYITSRELVDYAHLHGVRIAAFTVNDNIRANELASWGVDFIISDAISEVYI